MAGPRTDKLEFKRVASVSAISAPDIQIGHGGKGTPPPVRRGGGDNSRGDGYPDYGQRLKRARMALFFAMAPIAMLFAVIAGAFMVRQTSRTLDVQTNSYVQEWVTV